MKFFVLLKIVRSVVAEGVILSCQHEYRSSTNSQFSFFFHGLGLSGFGISNGFGISKGFGNSSGFLGLSEFGISNGFGISIDFCRIQDFDMMV